MKPVTRAPIALGAFLFPALSFAQDTAQRVAGKLPSKAICLICAQNGESEEEKPAGAVAYRGKTYYFCNQGEIAAFLKDPEAYLPAPVPRPAPAFALPTPAGETATLASFSSKALLVDFWATWCQPCLQGMPALQKLHDKYSPRGFAVIGIAVDEEGAKKVAPFLAKRPRRITYPVLLDPSGQTWKAWGVKSLPTLALVHEGRIVRQWSGKIDPRQVEQAVLEALQPAP